MESKPGGNIRSALNVLAELRGGQLVTEMSAALHDAVAAVKEHGKKAIVSVELVIVPATNQNLREPAIVIVPTVKSKMPTETPDSTLFFIDEDGNPTRDLARDQRREPDLPFNVVRPTDNPTAANGA